MGKQPSRSGGDATLFHLATEPLVVVGRASQQIERNLVD